MANAFAAGASGASWDRLTETAYDRSVEYYLRDEPQWRQVIDKRPANQAMPGDIVTLTLHNALGLATSPLTETVDVDSVAPPAPTRVLVTVQEYGNSTLNTLRLQETAFTQPTAELTELVGRNMQDSIDSVVKAVADAGTQILWMNGGSKTTSGANASVTTADKLGRDPATAAVSILRRKKTTPKVDGKYVAMIHPDASFDLQAENSATAWNSPHTYGGDTANIYSGMIGDFQGARYVETTRCTISTDGTGSINVYSTYFLAKQALVEVPVITPHVVIGPVVDHLNRFHPIGWHALAGWALYRPEAMVIVRTNSSIATL